MRNHNLSTKLDLEINLEQSIIISMRLPSATQYSTYDFLYENVGKCPVIFYFLKDKY